MLKGQCLEIPAPGKNQKIPLYGALDYRTNKVSYHIGYSKNAEEFLGFLAQLAYEYRESRCIFMLDNASYRTARIVQKFLDELSSRFQAIWAPPYCHESDDTEHICKYIRGASLANFDFRDTSSLRRVIEEISDELNSNPRAIWHFASVPPLSKNLLRVA